MKPQRIQLRRAKGWRMPANTVKVDRTTAFGNPFVVGPNGTRADCVRLYTMLMGGYLCLSSGNVGAQGECVAAVKAAIAHKTLRGKNLACWCPIGAPCHGDLLLEIVNARRRINKPVPDHTTHARRAARSACQPA